jgi:hypothetical protein
MTKISKRVLEFRERQRRGSIMRPSTFAAIERKAARGGMRDPEAVAGAAYWQTLAAKYRGNPSSVYSMAVHLGYPYLRGEGKVAEDGRTWLSRVTKQPDGSGPALFVGWDQVTRKWVIEEESSNPDLEKTGGLHIVYSPPNQAYFLMWHGTVLRIFPTKAEAKAEMEYLLRPSKQNPRQLTVPERHQLKIARDTLRMPDAMVGVMGGPTKAQAREIVRRLTGKAPKGNPRKKQRKFRDVAVGETFEFWDPWHSSMRGPWIKKSVRTYVHESDPDGQKYRVGSITAKVLEPGASNPDGAELGEAERLYEEFHGREPREILELAVSAEESGNYTALGDLLELIIDSPAGDRVKLKFKGDGVKLASSPDGSELYLFGGSQDLTECLDKFGADTSKELIDLGEAYQVVYDAAKWQTDFKPQDWEHKFGEESGLRPRVFYDQRKQRIFFAGGTYRVERPGIVD